MRGGVWRWVDKAFVSGFGRLVLMVYIFWGEECGMAFLREGDIPITLSDTSSHPSILELEKSEFQYQLNL